jgi:dTMP kinase
MAAGRFIALEGTDGSGKSTIAKRLAASIDAVLTREPGGSRIGELIRGVLLDPAHTEMADRAEALLYAADRAQHIVQVVQPALAAGRHVITDRSAYSSLAYQAFGRELPFDEVHRINDWAIQGCWPDLVVLLTVTPETAAARMRRSLDRLEVVDDGFRRRVNDGFATMAAREPDRWVTVDGNGSADEVAQHVLALVRERIDS